MKFISLLLVCATATSGYATQYCPWFNPPFELDLRLSYLFTDITTIASKQGTFRAPSKHHTLHTSLAMTPWPYWNFEGELFLTHASEISPFYEASRITLRYNWLDDIEGDYLSLVTGVTATFPGSHFLHNVGFLYRAPVESEFHLTLGREWFCDNAWIFRLWGLGGYGVATRGSPWFHSLGWIEYKPHPHFELGVFTEGYWGLGQMDLLPLQPFPGYGSIQYKRVNIGGEICFEMEYLGDLMLLGWYNIYARECMRHDWGTKISLFMTFGLM